MPAMPSARPAAASVRGPWLWAAASAAAFLLLALLVAMGVTDAFDDAVGDLVRDPAARGALAPLRQATELGSTWAVTAVAVLLLVVAAVGNQPRRAMFGALVIGTGAALIEAVKALVARARPEILEPILAETGYSFPSGHAANAMVAYGILAVVVGRSPLPPAPRMGIRVVLALLIGLVGISRVWLGVHYPTDVLAGWALGAVAVSAYVAITRQAWPAPIEAAAGEDPGAPRSGPPAEG